MFAKLFAPRYATDVDKSPGDQITVKASGPSFIYPTVPLVGEENVDTVNSNNKGTADKSLENVAINNAPYLQQNVGEKKPPAINKQTEATAPKPEKARVKESLKGTGYITRLNDDIPKGVIDGKYLFSKDEFCKPGCQFTENTCVDFEAEKCLGDSSYTVVSMKVHVNVSTDREELSLVHSRKYSVKVKEIRENDVLVQFGKPHEVHVVPKYLMPLHTVLAGDWLKVVVICDEDGESATLTDLQFDKVKKENITSVRPTQIRSIVAQLIRRKSYNVINGDIFCSDDMITLFHSGCMVKVDAVESDQVIQLSKGSKKLKWRAIEVQMSAFASYMDVNIEDTDPDTVKKEEEMRALKEDKRGIRLTPKEVNFTSIKIGNCSEKEVEVSNIADISEILYSIRIVGDQNIADFIPVIIKPESEDIITVLKTSDRYVFKITCRPTGSGLGRTKALILFDFGTFRVATDVKVNVLSNDPAEMKIIQKPTVDTRERRNWKKKKSSEVAHEMVVDASRPRVRGIQPVRAPFFVPRRIPIYHIPKVLWNVFKTEDEQLMATEYPGALNPLVFGNYIEKFSVCLWFEEMENDRRRRETDLKDICLRQEGEFFIVSVPGLKDYQPPLLIGDPLDVLNASNPNSEKFEGFIHKVVDNTIFIKFSEAFYLTYKGEKLNVQFRLGRMTFKRNHFAINTAIEYLGRGFLFPKETVLLQEPRIYFEEPESDSEFEDAKENDSDDEQALVPKVAAINLFNKPPKFTITNTTKSDIGNVNPLNRRAHSITKQFVSDSAISQSSPLNPAKLKWVNKGLNEEQKEAVRRILQGRARPIPYIIFGPPGTGKTMTLVEAVIQINLLDSNARLLVCAPSNAAADVIAKALVKSKRYKPGDFVRLNGYMRTDSQIEDELRPFSVDGEFLDSVMQHKIIVCTCVTAGQFFSLNLLNGHFTHVLIDEAGYCTEPETMIPSVLLALEKGGQLILAGDPFQLGPVLLSDAANNMGIQMSFLQRLMEKHPLYQRNTEKFPETKYNPNAVTKLVKNYRTHETLLKIPSQLFYDDELVACASHEDAYELCQDPKIAKEIFQSNGIGVPIVFHGIQGNSARDPDSPSWFNTAEIVEVIKYVRALKRCGLTNEDIGIITPYRKQVDKIKQTCLMEQNKRKEKDIPKIGSVEEFQGGERKVIIISTVRSIYEEKIDQQVGRLTFIYSHKRFNVALTRAKALLIVIGNPHILCRNKNWRRLISYCKELGSYKGCNLPLQLEPKYLQELEMAERDKAAVAHTFNPPDKPNRHYNPDGILSDEEEDEEE